MLIMATVAVADVLMNRSIASWRGLVFVLLLGSSSVLMTSLPTLWFPDLSAPLLLALKASLGPLCGALALSYLGLWLGAATEDRIVYYTLTWGAAVLAGASVVLAYWALHYQGLRPTEVVEVAAIASGIAMLLGLAVTARAYALGDQLAGWMVVACLFLAGMILGLYAYTLHPVWFGWKGMALTAFCTVAHFLVVTALTVQRNRQARQLQRLAGLAQGADPATGLPTGSVLLSKVDDAFWRSARRHGDCTVVCVHLQNLYELGESAGHRVDQQILSTITARIRQGGWVSLRGGAVPPALLCGGGFGHQAPGVGRAQRAAPAHGAVQTAERGRAGRGLPHLHATLWHGGGHRGGRRCRPGGRAGPSRAQVMAERHQPAAHGDHHVLSLRA